METVTTPSFSSSNTSDEFNMSIFHKVNSYVRYERFDELLKLIDIDGERRTPVNLMNDPVLSVVISVNKTKLAVNLIWNVKSIRSLLDENIYGDTALHIAAIKGNFDVVWELLSRESLLAAREPQLVKAIAAIKGNIVVAKALLQRESQLMEAIEAVEGNITVPEALLQTESQLVEATRELQLVEAIVAVEENFTVVEALLQEGSLLMMAIREPQLVKAIAAIEENITVAEALLEAAREPQLVEAIAAVKRNITVAKALPQRVTTRESQMVKAVNKKGETAVHKAAMYGHRLMFWFLQRGGEMARYRTNDGSNVLHCTIMGNNPELALVIARRFPELIMSRDEAELTPLQLIVTIPSFQRSPLVSGRLKRFLYKLIPIEIKDGVQDTIAGADEEAGRPVDSDSDEESLNRFFCKLILIKEEDHVIQGTNARADEEAGRPVDSDSDEESYRCTWKSVRSKFRSPYTTILDLTKLIASWVRFGVLVILKQVYRPVKYLEKEKKRYMAAMKLVEYLAEKTRFDFYAKGYSREPNPTVFDAMRSHSNHQYTRRDDILKYILNEADRLPSRWMEPPLIIAAELGSAIYLDSKGRNVMQVAIQSGHEKVVRVISEMLQGSNPVLPSCLYSMLDNETRNTILHLAAENSPVKEGDALQLHHEFVWFEMVEKIVPRELVYSRNRQGKTAHELLTNRHEQMLERCKDQLVKIGSTCAGLVAAVVFASSFSIPTHKDNQSDKLAYTIFTHAYLIGFGCATTALVLFLSLVVTPYQERYFRRAIPRHFLLACLSFALTLVGFLVSFACNFVLQIYGGQKMQKMQLVKLVLELLLFPLVCIIILLFSGAKLVPSFSPYWK